MKSIAIIPARGGSKRIPRKNIKDFMGKPVIAYSIEAALSSGLFDEVMVSTEDPEIAEVAKRYGAHVPFMRSGKNADDFATTAQVILEVLECYRAYRKVFGIVCCIYATAPFISPERLTEAFQMINHNQYDSVFTVAEFSHPLQRALKLEDGYIRPIWPEHRNMRSQDLSKSYYDAGQFYFSTTEALAENNSFWGKRTGGLILPEIEVQDLDSPTDWELAEMKYQLIHS